MQRRAARAGPSRLRINKMPALRLTATRSVRLTRFFPRDLGAFFSRFGEADGDGLLAAGYAPALAAFARPQSAAFPSADSASDRFACSLTVSAARTGILACHVSLLSIRLERQGKVCGTDRKRMAKGNLALAWRVGFPQN